MAQVSTNEFKQGLKVEVDGEPYVMVSNEFCKPGKGQPFNRVKLKHLMSRRVIERTFKSGEKLVVADVEELKVRLLYCEPDAAVFMHDETFEQLTVPFTVVGEKKAYLMEEILYDIIVYKGEPVDIEPPLFLEMKITKTEPGLRGDSSGRALKPGTTETGAKIQIPIFINEGEKVKIDTRDGSYVGRA